MELELSSFLESLLCSSELVLPDVVTTEHFVCRPQAVTLRCFLYVASNRIFFFFLQHTFANLRVKLFFERPVTVTPVFVLT